MPFSLRMIKQCSQNGIDYKGIHIVDVMSILCSIDIDNIKQYLKAEKQKYMQDKGIASVSKATESDFDNL